ncbi:hypothetical protein [Kribbella speibonae]|uniref:Uncharacterized protein n=1 Tax=Kribbella speibonae TaxID=1572660 RepID=A0A4R0IFJ5_9ACTN|nr:hypothetical protein [Kribbella speibonae]TCC32033.1 hypothetical protein E0H92_36660 [Kribbella speibonae]
MANVAVPEKTLEHWASQYLLYRYRSKVALWWPVAGQDIDIAWLPNRPGKAVQIELKTVTVSGAGLQDVKVDLGQLWEYSHLPPSQQPFYAFPRPDWTGELAAEARRHRIPVTDLAFSRSGPGWWFADWMVVLTTAQVARVLATDLARHGSRSRKASKRLVRYDFTHGSTPIITWSNGKSPSPRPLPWRQFWDTIQNCGQVGWPQLIRLPYQYLTTTAHYSADQVRGLLRTAANDAELRGADLITLVPDADGGFQVAPEDTVNLAPDFGSAEPEDGIEDHRQLVYLDANAMSGT